MSFTAKLLVTTTAGTLGIAGWFAAQDDPETKPTVAAVPTDPATQSAPAAQTGAAPVDTLRAQWEQRRKEIRAVLPDEPPTKVEGSRWSSGYSELLKACIDDLESDKTGALTLNFDEIGAPDIGVIYDRVEVVHTNYDDPEVLHCLTESMYAYVGEAPDEPYHQTHMVTMPLGKPTAEAAKDHQFIGYIVGAHSSEVRFCQTKAEGEVEVEGEVAVVIEMGPEGRPTAVTAAESALPDAVVECIVGAAKRWKFPDTMAGKSFDYTFEVPVPGRPPGKVESTP